MKNSSAFYFLNSLKYYIFYKDNFPWHTIYRPLMLPRTPKGVNITLCGKKTKAKLGAR